MSALVRFRVALGCFIFGLVLSGVTAFPLLTELKVLANLLGLSDTASPANYTGLPFWILTVRDGLQHTYARYPWMGYGTDWLAFGHLVIAMFFYGPMRDPVANSWVLKIGVLACVAVIPLAMICGSIRSIPLYWRLIDCAFGVVGLIPLLYCLHLLPRIASNGDRRPVTLPGPRDAM